MSRVLYLQTDSGKNAGQFLIDAQTRRRPVLSNSAGIVFRLGAYHFDAPVNLASLTSLNFEIRRSAAGSETEAPLATKNATLPINSNLVLLSLWNSRTSWNAEIEFTPEELSYTIPEGQTFVELWMVVTAEFSGGGQYTLGAGNVRLVASQDTETVGPAFMLKSVYDANNDGVADRATVADSVAWANVSGKPASFTPASHTHTKSAITDLGVFSAGNTGLVPNPGAGPLTGSRVLRDNGTWGAPTVAWADIVGAPEDWNPASHSHDKSAISDLEDFSGAGESNLVPDPGIETGAFLRDDGTWSHEADFAGSGASGLVPDPGVETGKFLRDDGTWAVVSAGTATWDSITGKPSTFAPSSHTHTRSQITDLDEFSGAGTTGLVPIPSSASGKYLRDDGAWETPSLVDVGVFAGAGVPGVVPDPGTESNRFLRDDGAWSVATIAWNDVTGKPSTFTPSSHTHTRSQISDLVTFTGTGTTGLVPNPGAATGKFLKDNGTWSNVPGGTDVVVFEVIPPSTVVTTGTHYVCRWGPAFNVSIVTVTFQTNNDTVSFTPLVDAVSFLNVPMGVTSGVTRQNTNGINLTLFPNGQIAYGATVQMSVTAGTYGLTYGMWVWFSGNWVANL